MHILDKEMRGNYASILKPTVRDSLLSTVFKYRTSFKNHLIVYKYIRPYLLFFLHQIKDNIKYNI